MVSTHDKGLRTLEEIVREKNPGRTIILCEEYEVIVRGKTYCGETDLLMPPEDDLPGRYYEYKSTDHHKARRKARQQLRRYWVSHPHDHFNFIYVTPQRVLRYYPESDHFVHFG